MQSQDVMHVNGIGELNPDNFPEFYVASIVATDRVFRLAQTLPAIIPPGTHAVIDYASFEPDASTQYGVHILDRGFDDRYTIRRHDADHALQHFDIRQLKTRQSHAFMPEITFTLPTPDSIRRPTAFEVIDIGERYINYRLRPEQGISSLAHQLTPMHDSLLDAYAHTWIEPPALNVSVVDDTAYGRTVNLNANKPPVEDLVRLPLDLIERLTQSLDRFADTQEQPSMPLVDTRLVVADEIVDQDAPIHTTLGNRQPIIQSGGPTTGPDKSLDLYNTLSKIANSGVDKVDLIRRVDRDGRITAFIIAQDSDEVEKVG